MYIEQKKSGKKTQIYICKKKRVTNIKKENLFQKVLSLKN